MKTTENIELYGVITKITAISAHDVIVDVREEWYVDIYENYHGANCAEYTGYSVASWSNLLNEWI